MGSKFLFCHRFSIHHHRFCFPTNLSKHWDRWGNLSDAIGLSAFAIQGAMYAVELNHPISAIIVSAALTGCGGGILRDVLAGKKAIGLQKEIYAVWAIIAGLALGSGVLSQSWQLYSLFAVITMIAESFLTPIIGIFLIKNGVPKT